MERSPVCRGTVMMPVVQVAVYTPTSKPGQRVPVAEGWRSKYVEMRKGGAAESRRGGW